jgi:cytochrome c-type biogenesis protein CcmH
MRKPGGLFAGIEGVAGIALAARRRTPHSDRPAGRGRGSPERMAGADVGGMRGADRVPGAAREGKARAGWLALVAAGLMLAAPAGAVQPDEMLEDPALEARAREISQELRCLVCRNESIDDSDAGLARDLRLLLRERLVAGDSDEAAVAYIVARYGEYVLLKPNASGGNLVLWLAGPLMLLLGGAVAVAMLRRRAQAGEMAALSPEDQARLEALLRE